MPFTAINSSKCNQQSSRSGSGRSNHDLSDSEAETLSDASIHVHQQTDLAESEPADICDRDWEIKALRGRREEIEVEYEVRWAPSILLEKDIRRSANGPSIVRCGGKDFIIESDSPAKPEKGTRRAQRKVIWRDSWRSREELLLNSREFVEAYDAEHWNTEPPSRFQSNLGGSAVAGGESLDNHADAWFLRDDKSLVLHPEPGIDYTSSILEKLRKRVKTSDQRFRLLQQPARRPIEFRSRFLNKGRSGGTIDFERLGKTAAILIQLTGDEQREPCNGCQTDGCVLAGCVVSPGSFDNACANCVYREKRKECHFNRNYGCQRDPVTETYDHAPLEEAAKSSVPLQSPGAISSLDVAASSPAIADDVLTPDTDPSSPNLGMSPTSSWYCFRSPSIELEAPTAAEMKAAANLVASRWTPQTNGPFALASHTVSSPMSLPPVGSQSPSAVCKRETSPPTSMLNAGRTPFRYSSVDALRARHQRGLDGLGEGGHPSQIQEATAARSPLDHNRTPPGRSLEGCTSPAERDALTPLSVSQQNSRAPNVTTHALNAAERKAHTTFDKVAARSDDRSIVQSPSRKRSPPLDSEPLHKRTCNSCKSVVTIKTEDQDLSIKKIKSQKRPTEIGTSARQVFVFKHERFVANEATEAQVRFVLAHCPPGSSDAAWFDELWKVFLESCERHGEQSQWETKEAYISEFWSDELNAAVEEYCPELTCLDD